MGWLLGEKWNGRRAGSVGDGFFSEYSVAHASGSLTNQSVHERLAGLLLRLLRLACLTRLARFTGAAILSRAAIPAPTPSTVAAASAIPTAVAATISAPITPALAAVALAGRRGRAG